MSLGKRPFFKMFYSWNLGPKLLFLHGLRASFYRAASALYCIARRAIWVGWQQRPGRPFELNPLCADGNQFPAKGTQESCFWNQWIGGDWERPGLDNAKWRLIRDFRSRDQQTTTVRGFPLMRKSAHEWGTAGSEGGSGLAIDARGCREAGGLAGGNVRC